MNKSTQLLTAIFALTLAFAPLASAQRKAKRGGGASAPTAAAAPAVREVKLEELKKLVADAKGQPLLINFWATWCVPCRAEFPDLVRIDQDFRPRGLNFVTVSLDEVSDIKTTVPQFLAEMKATRLTNVLLADGDPGAAISAIDPDWSGALPATFLYDRQGALVFKHTGAVKPAPLRAALEKAFGGTTATR